jgi:hypothetical protein
MSDGKLKVVYAECDADADTKQLLRSCSGACQKLECLSRLLLLLPPPAWQQQRRRHCVCHNYFPHPLHLTSRHASGQTLPHHETIDHVVLLKSRSIFTNVLKGKPSHVAFAETPVLFPLQPGF